MTFGQTNTYQPSIWVDSSWHRLEINWSDLRLKSHSSTFDPCQISSTFDSGWIGSTFNSGWIGSTFDLGWTDLTFALSQIILTFHPSWIISSFNIGQLVSTFSLTWLTLTIPSLLLHLDLQLGRRTTRSVAWANLARPLFLAYLARILVQANSSWPSARLVL